VTNALTVGRDAQAELVDDVRHGLTLTPKRLPARWLYDDRGSDLFEQITELPEYYQTRTEASILEGSATTIMSLTTPEAVVELGAGSCSKSRILIDAGRSVGSLTSYTPLDISDGAMGGAVAELRAAYPGLAVNSIVGDFLSHLSVIPRQGRQLVVFLGSTLGNFEDEERSGFLRGVRGLLTADDAFLLGLDLVKPEAELVAAYDDAAGVTADFNLNLLAILNRELGADFDAAKFEHVARYNHSLHRMELYLRSQTAQRVHIPRAALDVEFTAGELMLTEISVKFTRPLAEQMMADASMRIAEWFTDPLGRFAMALARPG
jgi:L-histidine N-alpha-methyltransferase